ncbi:hypothetical protein ACI65C_002850 [Semiaphis heraclei]
MTIRHFPAAVCVCLAHTQQFRPPSSQHNLIVQPPLPPTPPPPTTPPHCYPLRPRRLTNVVVPQVRTAYDDLSVFVRHPSKFRSFFFLHARRSVFVCTGKRRRYTQRARYNTQQ